MIMKWHESFKAAYAAAEAEAVDFEKLKVETEAEAANIHCFYFSAR